MLVELASHVPVAYSSLDETEMLIALHKQPGWVLCTCGFPIRGTFLASLE